jgi:predicted dehydrogenase
MGKARLAVLGVGLIGVRHAEIIRASDDAELIAIADPSEEGRAVAARLDVRRYDDFRDLLERESLDGVVVAVPNQLHLPAGLACVEAGLPALVEKPLADSLEAGAELVLAAERRGVPLLVGHHRRFNPMVETAREILAAGELGRLVAVSAMWAACKPDDYFDVQWRREEGGGPVLINLIHDVDCLRHLCGEIEQVQAFAGSAVRGLAVEDSAVVALRFAGGALGTVTLSDACPSPWSWEAGSGDNPGIAASGRNCYRFLGTQAALDFPNLVLWRTSGGRRASWAESMTPTERSHPPGEALPAQIRHFTRVIAGLETPRVSGRDGFATLATTLAVKEAARSGTPVRPATLPALDPSS